MRLPATTAARVMGLAIAACGVACGGGPEMPTSPTAAPTPAAATPLPTPTPPAFLVATSVGPAYYTPRVFQISDQTLELTPMPVPLRDCMCVPNLDFQGFSSHNERPFQYSFRLEGARLVTWSFNRATGIFTLVNVSDATVSHVAYHPSGRLLFTIRAFGSPVFVHNWLIDERSGALTLYPGHQIATFPTFLSPDPAGRYLIVGTRSTLFSYSVFPTGGGITPSAIPSVAAPSSLEGVFDRDGKYYYQRTFDQIVAHSVSPDGSLQRRPDLDLASPFTIGAWARDSMSNTLIVAGAQRLTWAQIGNDGRLVFSNQSISIPGSVTSIIVHPGGRRAWFVTLPNTITADLYPVSIQAEGARLSLGAPLSLAFESSWRLAFLPRF